MDESPKENGIEGAEESFAEMLESSLAGSDRRLKVGDKVVGKIIGISNDSVFIDTGAKIDGVADRSELLNEDGEMTLGEGDSVELFVVSTANNEVKLSKAIGGVGGAAMLQEAYESGLPVEGRVAGTCKGGFNVTVLQRRAFCPISQIDMAFVEDGEAYVGESYQFLITRFEQDGRNIVVSRRSLLEREREENLSRMEDQLTPGSVLEAKVVRLAPFGAFVELAPGVDGLVHISELGWSRVDSPDELVSEGDVLQVKVLSVEQGKKGPRISLSVKQAGPDPWDSVGDKVKKGDMLEGTVVRLAKFGAFVELFPGLEGLIHISEMSYKTRVHKPEDVLSEGQKVTTKVKDVDPESRRISLSLRDAQGDPWGDVPNNFPVGTELTGSLEKKEEFGFFVTLEPGVTGLIPISRIKRASNRNILEKLRTGDEIKVRVDELDIDKRKATLSPVDPEADQAAPKRGEKREWANYSSSSEDSGMNSLGDMLNSALAKKKRK